MGNVEVFQRWLVKRRAYGTQKQALRQMERAKMSKYHHQLQNLEILEQLINSDWLVLLVSCYLLDLARDVVLSRVSCTAQCLDAGEDPAPLKLFGPRHLWSDAQMCFCYGMVSSQRSETTPRIETQYTAASTCLLRFQIMENKQFRAQGKAAYETGWKSDLEMVCWN